jgi:uncharacterized membrane protein
MDNPPSRYSETVRKRHSLTSVFGSGLLLGLFGSFLLEIFFVTDIRTTIPSFNYLILSGVFVGGFLVWLFYQQPYASCYPLTVIGMSFVIVGILFQLPLTIAFSLGVSMFMSLTGIAHTFQEGFK